jgi:polysaccharide export outer membrane protein
MSNAVEQSEETQEFNQFLSKLSMTGPAGDYLIGPGDLLEITVLEASELNRSLRVSAEGNISMPPLGAIHVAGRTPQEVEKVLTELLQQSIMHDPHVTAFVKEMESHPVSVTGAVKKPGVFLVRSPKALLEILSMAEGLAEDAGDSVLVMRGAGFPTKSNLPSDGLSSAESRQPGSLAETDEDSDTASPDAESSSVKVDLKSLLNTDDPRLNVTVYPGDIVKVTRAGIVYVLGDVRKPGGFILQNNENISVLQALAMAEGTTPTAANGQARIIRTDESSGHRTEIALDIGQIMKGKLPDQYLQPKDIVFVPKSGGKSAFFRTAEAIVSTVPAALIYGGL